MNFQIDGHEYQLDIDDTSGYDWESHVEDYVTGRNWHGCIIMPGKKDLGNPHTSEWVDLVLARGILATLFLPTTLSLNPDISSNSQMFAEARGLNFINEGPSNTFFSREDFEKLLANIVRQVVQRQAA